MASFDTSKIVSDIKSGKIKRKEPPKYIFVKHPRNNTKKKKLNPRWTAWNKNKNKRDIDEKVETYVKKNQGGQKINKDLTKDFSKNKESGVGPIREGNKYAKNIKTNKKGNTTSNTNGKPTSESKTESKTESKKDEKLKIGYRRTKGEGIDRKGGDGYRGDTRITAKLKKAGFTESRLAKIRADHAKWKADRKKKKKKKS